MIADQSFQRFGGRVSKNVMFSRMYLSVMTVNEESLSFGQLDKTNHSKTSLWDPGNSFDSK